MAMSVFNACPAPDRKRLAFYNAHRFILAESGIPAVERRLGMEYGYWENQAQRAVADVDVARELVSFMMRDEIAEDFLNLHKFDELPPLDKKNYTQRATAIIGLSILFSRLFPAPRPESKEARAMPNLELEGFSDLWLQDAVLGGPIAIYPEMPIDEKGRPSEYHLHIAHGVVDHRFDAELSTELPEAWFVYNNLYVKVAPGQSRPELEAKAAERGREIDFSRMHVFTPHTQIGEEPAAPINPLYHPDLI